MIWEIAKLKEVEEKVDNVQGIENPLCVEFQLNGNDLAFRLRLRKAFALFFRLVKCLTILVLSYSYSYVGPFPFLP